MRKLILPFALILFTFSSCNQPTENPATVTVNNVNSYQSSLKQKRIVNIWDLVKKSPSEVSKVLGKPNKIIRNSSDCASGLINHCSEIHYQKDKITVLYTQYQIAYWFEFDNLHEYQLVNLPELFGLDNSPPSAVGDGYIWFDNYSIIKRISFTPLKTDPSKIDYAIVEVNSKDLPMNSFK